MPAKKSPKPTPYRAHRIRQRFRILDAAKTLFDKNGIDRVTMADITSASGLRASTMYQYFSNKDEIVWAITSDVMKASTERVKQNIQGAPNALARIARVLEFMADQLSNHQSEARFMAQFDAMYARDWPVERLLKLESQINPDGFGSFSKLVRQGIKDGSLRKDLDPKLTMHAVVNSIVGAQRRLASLGDKVELEYGQPIDQLFRETIRIILLGLRGPRADLGSKTSKRSKLRKRTTRRRIS